MDHFAGQPEKFSSGSQRNAILDGNHRFDRHVANFTGA